MAEVQLVTGKNLETFSLVLLGSSVNILKDNIVVESRLRSSINYLKIFEDKQECEQYIKSVSLFDRIILIVSNQLGQEIVPRIHQLRQISQIYIYYFDNQKNQQWIQQYPKIQNIILKFDQLVTQISHVQCKRQYNDVNESLAIITFNSFLDEEQSTRGLNGEFIHFQLLIDCLQRMELNSTDRNELISLCKQQYNGNVMELQRVEEFEQYYSSNQSLWWYTRPSFVYRMLNKALRIQNIHLLFLFHFLIRDLGEQLEQHRCSSRLSIYRGQLMTKNELERLKQSCGELISINSFLSTSLQRHVSLFLLTDSAPTDGFERILFEIDADPQLPGIKSFANISSLSFFPEEEILFMPGSIFRILNVTRNENGIWIIQMKLSSDHDSDMKRIFDYIKNENGQGETNIINFGNVLLKMGKVDEVEKYYHRYLNQLSPNDYHNIAGCYYSLGSLAEDRGDYESSLQWLQKSLKIRIQILKPDDVLLADTHNSIAIVHKEIGDLKQALENYNIAMIIYRRALGEDHKDLAMCFTNIGNVYTAEKKYWEAYDYHQKALDIGKKHFPNNHPSLGALYNNIGNVHRHVGQFDLALEYFDLSLEIYKKALPAQHPYIAATLKNIGHVYEENKNDLKQALSYYEKAAMIFHHALPHTHSSVIEIDQYIDQVLFKLK